MEYIRQLAPLFPSKDVCFFMSGKLYRSCVRSCMLHGSETWPVRKENELALQTAEMVVMMMIYGVWQPETGLQHIHTYTHTVKENWAYTLATLTQSCQHVALVVRK